MNINILKLLGCLFFLVVFYSGMSGCSKKIYPPPARTPQPIAVQTPSAEEPAAKPDDQSLTPTQRRYTVMGQTYTPVDSHEGFVEEGVASWYGPKFHGKRTSNGEIYNMYGMTAAHRLLPMNTLVRVTNLDNGKVVDLRINDRGPFVGNRIIDLSFAAARDIEMIGPGTANVRVEAKGSVPKEDIAGNFYIQVGSFSSKENAEKMKNEMQQNGYKGTRLQESTRDNQRLWRVQAGKFNNLLSAEQAHTRLQGQIPGAFIIAD
ncbi:MAG: septal ring lytic transglycosylase RlpA family protein [Desulfonatronovibrio sp. MSAO_Bac4]|nr:MAG: septal ring lytic transglycosylase RlpA family protein [Desulfonatronovibrio sp. MSAO_Bac4]